MGGSEQAIKNIESILGSMRDSCVQGSNDTLGIDEQKKIADQLMELKKQLINEGNVSYDGGRYLFSGFRTDTKLVFDKTTDKKFEITQSFTKEDIEEIEIAGKHTQDKKPGIAYRIRLAYDNLKDNVSGLTVTTMDSNSNDAYYPTNSGTVHYLRDTGELIFHEEDIDTIADFTISYEKHSFKGGDLNPVHYFECEDLDGGEKYVPSTEKIQYEVGINNKIEVNILGKDILTTDLMRDIDELSRLVDEIYSIEEDVKKGNKPEDERMGLLDVSRRFNSLIGKLDKHLSQISTEKSGLGNRMKRLELVSNRLAADELNFKELNNDNEGVDLEEVYTEFSMQQIIYNSALNATAKVIQPTLLDFIR